MILVASFSFLNFRNVIFKFLNFIKSCGKTTKTQSKVAMTHDAAAFHSEQPPMYNTIRKSRQFTERMVTRHWLFSTRIMDNRIIRPLLLLLSCLTAAMALELASVQNLRPVLAVQSSSSSSSSSSFNLYRSASLDKLSMHDAQTLLLQYGNHGVTIVDLRNADEIEKGAKERTEGAQWFYRQLVEQQQHSLVHVPILQDINAFWDEAIARMPVQSRAVAILHGAFLQGGALDQAAARHMEQGGHVALNTIMLASCGRAIRKALDVVCAVKSSSAATVATATVTASTAAVPLVLFHCQKGKDRTGMLAMLLQHCLGDSESEVIQAYGKSGALLLLEEDADNTASSAVDAAQKTTGLVDWSHFRGSPESAMRDTLLWIQATYGSMDCYLDSIGFSKSQRRKALQRTPTTTTDQL
jgi:Tyrosine phosphatase family